MPLSAAHRALLEDAEAAGYGELDNSSIINVHGCARAAIELPHELAGRSSGGSGSISPAIPAAVRIDPLRRGARMAVLCAAFGGLLFDGFELGLMPLASLSVSQDLLGGRYTPTLGGDWFARFTAALMLGAAIGGILLGSLGDRIGRARAMGVSILFYSVFAGMGAWVQTQEQMLVLRFMVGLGVGGVWPNAVALVAECWPDKARPTVAGLMGVAINAGILMLSQIAQVWSLTADSWRWLFTLAAAPAVLGLLVLFVLPESPAWLASRGTQDREDTRDARA